MALGHTAEDWKAYVGSKVVRATPCDRSAFFASKGEELPRGEVDQAGYAVQYPDGYQSWSPKAVFEGAYRRISDGEKGLIE